MDTDEKPETKKDGDVEMKTEEGSSAKHGDISPINGSISNLAEDGKPSASKTRKGEPTSEKLANFSRVTPAQLAHISFPADGRYQPVRAVSTRAPNSKGGKSVVQPAGSKSATAALGMPSERYAGGGGILILVDQSPDEEAEFIEFTAPATVAAPADAPAANGHATAGPAASGPHIALDESSPEADPPESFEVSSVVFLATEHYLTHLCSTLLTKIAKFWDDAVFATSLELFSVFHIKSIRHLIYGSSYYPIFYPLDRTSQVHSIGHLIQ